MRWRLAAIAAIGAILLGSLVATPAVARAVLVEAQPAPETKTGKAPTTVRLDFSEPVDVSQSQVHVRDAEGVDRDAGTAFGDGTPNSTRLLQNVSLPSSGNFTVAWSTVSTTDAHASSGSFWFLVATPSSGATSSSHGQGSTMSVPGPATWLVVAAFAACALVMRRGRAPRP